MTDMQQRIVGYGKRKERLPQGLVCCVYAADKSTAYPKTEFFRSL